MTGTVATSHAQLEGEDPFIEIGEIEGDPNADEPQVEPTAGTPEPLNAQISQHILKLAEEEREKRMKFMHVVIDDVARLSRLDNNQRDQLDLAAKGATERSMKDWHEQAERYFRTRLDGSDPDAAKEILEGMGSVNFGGNRSEEEGETLDLWKDTLKVVLSDDQIERYERVLEERHLDRIDAFARMSLTTIDSHLRLTPEQKTELEVVIRQAATEYLDDVQRYWGDYFERGMLMSLANAVEPDELKEILNETQFERLKEATSNFDHFWDQKRIRRRAEDKEDRKDKLEADEEEYQIREAEPVTQ